VPLRQSGKVWGLCALASVAIANEPRSSQHFILSFVLSPIVHLLLAAKNFSK